MNRETSDNTEPQKPGYSKKPGFSPADALAASPLRAASLPLNRTFRSIVGWSLVLFWVGVFIGTHVPDPNMGDLPKNSDKLMHFAAYAALSFLLGVWWAARRRMTPREYAVVFVVTASYGILDELLQAIPVLNRSCDPADALADWCGSLIGLSALYVFVRVWRWGFVR